MRSAPTRAVSTPAPHTPQGEKVAPSSISVAAAWLCEGKEVVKLLLSSSAATEMVSPSTAQRRAKSMAPSAVLGRSPQLIWVPARGRVPCTTWDTRWVTALTVLALTTRFTSGVTSCATWLTLLCTSCAPRSSTATFTSAIVTFA